MNFLFSPRLFSLFTVLILFSTLSCAKDDFSTLIVEESADEISDSDEENDESGSDDENDETNSDSNQNTDDSFSTELKAFPSAYGAGAYASGGRGGQIVHVTNLNDSGTGSFRWALQQSSPKIIVFDISGVIELNSLVAAEVKNTTIAGQTAPQGGITISGNRVAFMQMENVIVRYLRFRGGISADNDSFTGLGARNVIFDHISASFADDEAFSIISDAGMGVENLTIQKCLFAESFSTGTIVGDINAQMDTGGDISVINNMWYNINHRFPNIAGNQTVDVINNIAWNYKNRLITVSNGLTKVNQINNYYRRVGGIDDTRVNRYVHNSDTRLASIYTAGNLILPDYLGQETTDNSQSWKFYLDVTSGKYAGKGLGDQLPDEFFMTEPHQLSGIRINPVAASSLTSFLPDEVGANYRLDENGNKVINRDSFDKEYVQAVKNNELIVKRTVSQYIVPIFESISLNIDADRDGMPDIWEIAKGLNPSVDDSSADADGDGYTNVEEYLNLIDVD
ncbi:polysaccharide lyase family 1 protein [uncultured Croceitalea sp.]|uniref:pectate lyase family protein n=1 Tax=uncultured Croceitalea sp. TaxID=1798908 RepID=UPI00374F0615